MSVRPPRQPRAFLAGAALIGAGMGWVAWRTRSLRWTLPAHLATDANGLSAASFWLGRPDDGRTAPVATVPASR
jgi:hypothetical protein